MADDTGPDPLTPAQRILILRDHLEREKSRRREAEARLAEFGQAVWILIRRAGGEVLLSDRELMEVAPRPVMVTMRERDGLRVAITGGEEEANRG